MKRMQVSVVVLLLSVIVCMAQEYDFGAEITRQCLVPDPVGLLDCVENKVDLPYLTSWVECTNSLGENVATSADVINYRCKSVWEGKAVIPEVFYIKDCVIDKTGLPAKQVSEKVLGAYKECEKSPPTSQQQQPRPPSSQQPKPPSSQQPKPPSSQQPKPPSPLSNLTPSQVPAFLNRIAYQPALQYLPPGDGGFFYGFSILHQPQPK